jgi:hypothetical protein
LEPAEQIRTILNGIETWANSGSKDSVNKAASKLAVGYANNIRGGYEADGSDMAALKPSTLEGPIRRGSDPTPRNHYGAVPLNASGALANSIKATRTSPIEWEIAGNDRGDMILRSNSKKAHSGYPFAGDTPKAIRDPLQVSEKQMDIIEDVLVQDLERVLASI